MYYKSTSEALPHKLGARYKNEAQFHNQGILLTKCYPLSPNECIHISNMTV